MIKHYKNTLLVKILKFIGSNRNSSQSQYQFQANLFLKIMIKTRLNLLPTMKLSFLHPFHTTEHVIALSAILFC